MYLVFSESYPNGKQLTSDELDELLKYATTRDRETMAVVPVAPELSNLLDQVLAE